MTRPPLLARWLPIPLAAACGSSTPPESACPAPPVAIPRTEDHVIRSEHVGEELRLWIAHPVAGWRGSIPGPVRVLYVLDADLFFGTAVETTRLMHQLYGELPPLLVVGVAYGVGPRRQAELRTRDLTPTADDGFARMRARLDPSGEPLLPEGRRMGGAARFLAFLTREVRPWIEARYDVARNGSVLFGSSLAGLFTLYALSTEPDAFDHYIAVSPALWWDDEVLFSMEADLAAERRDVDADVFLAVGALEEDARNPMLARFRLVTNVERLAETLRGRGYPSLRLRTSVLEGETHTSVVPVALARGLRGLRWH